DTARTVAMTRARMRTSLETLRRRLAEEPGVEGVTFVDALPRDQHREDLVQVVTVPGKEQRWVSMAYIDPSYFDVLGTPLRGGRPFNSSDLGDPPRVAIVDQGF